ncbi:MAG: hypothetical protein ABL952_17755 [Pyrinomonadaceae bacterium]
MPNSKFIKHIGVSIGNVDDGEIGIENVGDHFLVDWRRLGIAIGPIHLDIKKLHDLFNEIVDFVELLALRCAFLAIWHDHEAGFTREFWYLWILFFRLLRRRAFMFQIGQGRHHTGLSCVRHLNLRDKIKHIIDGQIPDRCRFQ